MRQRRVDDRTRFRNSGAITTSKLHAYAKLAIRRATPGQATIHVPVAIGHARKDLKLHIGPGDDAEPVLTLMHAHED